MFCFYVCNNHHRRREPEEGSVVLIRFDNDDIPFTHDGICLVNTVNPAAYNDGRSKFPACTTWPAMVVVVVLPWVPAIPIPNLVRISSASISDRLMTGIFRLSASRVSIFSSAETALV